MQRFKEFVDNQKFRKATTAIRNPHEYVVRHKTVTGTDEDFVYAVMFIREHGFPVMFWGKEYIVYYLEGHMYWTMGCPIEETKILNRNNIEDYEVSFKPREVNR